MTDIPKTGMCDPGRSLARYNGSLSYKDRRRKNSFSRRKGPIISGGATELLIVPDLLLLPKVRRPV